MRLTNLFSWALIGQTDKRGRSTPQFERTDDAEKALKRIAASHYAALGKWESDLIRRAADLASRHPAGFAVDFNKLSAEHEKRISDRSAPAMNRPYYSDNLQVLREHIADDSVDLIYLDPPLNSKRDYNLLFKTPKVTSEAQIEDTWH